MMPKKVCSFFVSRSLNEARTQVLDTVESAFGHLPQWPFVRSRILKALGKDGVEGKLLQSSQTTRLKSKYRRTSYE